MSEFNNCDKNITGCCNESQQDQPIRNSAKQQCCNTNSDSNIEEKPLALVKKTVVVSKNIKKKQIPDDIINNEALNLAIKNLPINYNFEIHKTIWRIRTEGSKLVALQFPEGLLLYACIITDILIKFAKVEVLILGDVTYGACCIDDYTAQKLGANLLVHYGHSCLVPINVTRIKVMYVFVEIHFDFSHLIDCINKNFNTETKLALMGTIQFTTAIHSARVELAKSYPNIFIPQSKPLSGGETLGCTSPLLPDCESLVFVADGRFHLEAAMIRNPHVKSYRYDPYSKVLSSEGYDVIKMKEIRMKAIIKAKKAKTFGIILGTLGRQGSTPVFNRLKKLLKDRGKIVIPFLMAEINPLKLEQIPTVEAWVQVACPRLSIDWGDDYPQPILTSYETEVAMEETTWNDIYPMDYYSADGGTWTNYHEVHRHTLKTSL